MLTRHESPYFTQPTPIDFDTAMLHRGAENFYGGVEPIAIHSEFVTIVADPHTISIILDDGREVSFGKALDKPCTLAERVDALCVLAKVLGRGTLEGTVRELLKMEGASIN